VLSPGSRMSINPYYVGYNILRDIERRWNGDVDPDFPESDWRDDAAIERRSPAIMRSTTQNRRPH